LVEALLLNLASVTKINFRSARTETPIYKDMSKGLEGSKLSGLCFFCNFLSILLICPEFISPDEDEEHPRSGKGGEFVKE
jgi:hypothetical protein